MLKKYVFPVTTDAESFLARTREAATSSGGTFDGDATKGTFGGYGVEGFYRVTGTQVEVTVVKKPMLIPWSLVDATLKNFFAPE